MKTPEWEKNMAALMKLKEKGILIDIPSFLHNTDAKIYLPG